MHSLGEKEKEELKEDAVENAVEDVQRKREEEQEEERRRKIVRGKQLRECKLKLKMMRKARDEFRAESASNLAIERANVDNVLKQGDQLAKDITKILEITEKHYKDNNRVSQLVKELSDKKLY